MTPFFVFICIVCIINIYSRLNAVERENKALKARLNDGVIAAQPQSSVESQPSAMHDDHVAAGAYSMPISVVSEPLHSDSSLPPPPTYVYAAEPSAATKQKSREDEFNLSSKAFTAVGIFAVLLGIGFFLRYAIDHDFITEPMRVFLGILTGIVMSAIGYFLRKKYEQYALSLIGGGFGVIYVSLYAAYAFYGLISAPLAFIILAAFVVLSVALALVNGSQALVAFAFLGGYLTPLILPISLPMDLIFIHLILLNLGVLLVARFKTWQPFTVGALVGTLLITLRWIGLQYTEQSFSHFFPYLVVFFVIFFITTILNYMRDDATASEVNPVLLYGVPTVFLVENLFISSKTAYIEKVLLGMAVFYTLAGLMSLVALAKTHGLRMFSNALVFMAALGYVSSTVLHFEGTNLTMLLAFESLAMIGVGHVLGSRLNKVGSIILTGIVGLRVIAYESMSSPGAVAIYNKRALIFLVSVLPFVALWLLATRVWIKREDLASVKSEAEREVALLGRYVGVIGAYGIVFTWLCIEISQFAMTDGMLVLSMAWSVFALAAIAIASVIKEPVLRILSYIVLLVNLCILFLSELFDMFSSSNAAFFNMRFGAVMVMLLSTLCVIWILRIKKAELVEGEAGLLMPLQVTAHALAFFSISKEIMAYFDNQMASPLYGSGGSAMYSTLEDTKRVVLSLFWLVYAGACLGAGVIFRSAFTRSLAIMLFAVTIFKIFLYDTANLTDIYRFVSFFTLGVILLLAGFVFNRFKDRIVGFVQVKED